MKPVDAAWLAAAIDGEGSISFTVEKKSRPKRGRKKQHFALFARVRLQVSNDNKRFLQNVKRIAGHGQITPPRKRISRQGVPGLGYQWVTRNIAAVEHVLRACLPFLIIKRKKALTAIRFVEFYDKLLAQPLRDPVRSARNGNTVRRKLANRGHRELCLWLSRHWFPRFPSTRGFESSLKLCLAAIRRTPLRLQYLTYRGVRRHVTDWARVRQVPLQTLRSRLSRGWPVGAVLETPVDRTQYPRQRHGEQSL